MDKYFRMFYNNNHYYGVVKNIPENIGDDTVKERIQTSSGSDTEWVKMCDETHTEPDIIMDWETIDCEFDNDQDMISILDCIDKSQQNDITCEVVYTALKYMKENPELSISESIEKSLSECVK